MKSRKIIGLVLVCAMMFALVLTGCNQLPGMPAINTTTTSATNGGNDDGWNDDGGNDDGWNDDGNSDATDNNGGDSTDVGTDSTDNVGGDVTGNGTKTTGKNTASSTTKATSGNKDDVLLPSFIRNDNKTMTDRDNGIVFIDDDCNTIDLNSPDCYIYDHGGSIWVDKLNRTLFSGDPCRIIRGDTTSSTNWWFTYKLEAGITEAALITFNEHSKERVRGFDIYVSTDNRKWTKVEPTYNEAEDIHLGYREFKQRTYRVSGIDKKNKYLKIQFTKIDGEQYEPLIGRVRINNVSRMNDPTRFLEGRAAQTFYISSKGSDENDGLSPEKPMTLASLANRYFQPGDKILFKAGETFTGASKITGFGSAAKRITIGTYGGTAKAKLQTRGEGTQVTLEVYADYVTIENLQISNRLGRTGLNIGANHTGANKDIIVQNCIFKDINVETETFLFETGAIQAIAGGAEPTWFENMTIRNNTIENVARIGIFVKNKSADRDSLVNGEYKNGNKPWYANKNVTIVNNTLNDVQGDVILVIGCNKTVIEKNYCNNSYCISDAMLKKHKDAGQVTSMATIWTQNVDKAYIQYNEVGYNQMPTGGNDGTAFDIDAYCTEHYIQYNYSHDNKGGFILLCEFDLVAGSDWYKMLDATQHEIRYNLSVNDGSDTKNFIFIGSKTLAQMNIYNNTIVQNKANIRMLFLFNPVKDYYFTNNIFFGAGACTIGDQSVSQNVVIDNNVFFGGTPSCTTSGVKLSNVKNVDPKFVNAAFTNTAGKALRKEAIAAFTPKNKITGATAVKNNGGKDINGTAISTNFYGCVKY